MRKIIFGWVLDVALLCGLLCGVAVGASWSTGRLDASFGRVLLDLLIVAVLTGIVALPAWLLSGRRD